MEKTHDFESWFSKLQYLDKGQGQATRTTMVLWQQAIVLKHQFYFKVKCFVVENVKNYQSGQGSNLTQ